MSFIRLKINRLLDLILPITCYFCHRPGSHLCKKCEARLFKPYVKRYCHVCHGLLRVPGHYVHRLCIEKTSLDGVFASYVLNGPLKEYIGEMKYGFCEAMLTALNSSIKLTMANRLFKYDLITYVPLHPHRENWRGFNQSRHIAKAIDRQVSDLIERRKDTPHQTLLHRKERKINVANCFSCPVPEKVSNRSILLCDDIFTTGATLDSCARVLKDKGASKVYGYCLGIDEKPCDA